MLSILTALSILTVSILLTIVVAWIIGQSKIAALHDQLLIRQQQLADSVAASRQYQTELLQRTELHLSISTQLATAVTERDLLKAKDDLLQQAEINLKIANESIHKLAEDLATVKAERDNLKSVEPRICQLSTQIDRQHAELLKNSSDLSAATTARDALRTQLLEANDRISQLAGEIREGLNKTERLIKENAELSSCLESERTAATEKVEILKDAESRLTGIFGALASSALKDNNQEFLRLANSKLEDQQRSATNQLEGKKEAISALLEAAGKQLEQLHDQVHSFEANRQTGEAKLEQQIVSLVELQHKLSDETRRLSKALEKPMVRGNWGEIQLRRVVELAGMIEYCDFSEQVTIVDDEGKKRPDLLVHLPNNRTVAVDAKVSLDAFIKAANTDSPDEFHALMQDHTDHIRKHIVDLSTKKYWSLLPKSPDLSIAFIPSEALYSAALQCDPSLLEFAATQQVLIATPTTLIALLRAVYYGWREEKLATSAEEISEIGRMVYKRLITLQTHLAKLGSSIDSAVENYNKLVGSIESSVFPAARRFEQLGAATEEHLDLVLPIERITKQLQGSDWQQAPLIEPTPSSANDHVLTIGAESK